jgi:hypothetical protein
MKKSKIILGIFSATILLASCNSNDAKADNLGTKSSENLDSKSKLEDDKKLIESIDLKRGEIEALAIKPVELKTENLREKVKQKWSKIHFYVNNDKVVKVKTYAYEGSSKRTEVFYADDKGLILVVIEDNGEGKKGKQKSELDKMYYFNEGEFLKEFKSSKEKELNVRNSDSEELMNEFSEYLEIFEKQKK